MKKILLLTTLLLVNIAIWAQEAETSGPEIVISSYVKEHTPNFSKFAEPSVTVWDNTKVPSENVTNQFYINYFIAGHENETTFRVNKRGAEYTLDDETNDTNKDKTNTTVERLYGDVIMGTSGTVAIRVVATPKNSSKYTKKLTKDYEIIIKSPDPTVSYMPILRETIIFNSTVNINKNDNGTYNINIGKTYTILPQPRIIVEGIAGQQKDITDYYYVEPILTNADGSDMSFTDKDYEFKLEKQDNTYRILFGQKGNVNNDLSYWYITSETQGKEKFPQDILKVTYKYTLKEEHKGQYPEILPEKSAFVRLAPLYDGVKENVHLALGADLIREENVTEKDGTYTIHVHKHGGQFNQFQYYTPNPAIMTDGGAQLPAWVGEVPGKKSPGKYGDFQLLYKVMDGIRGVKNPEYTPDEELGTYYDDCMHSRTDADPTSNVVYAGEPTGIQVYDSYFQTAKPGLVKVAVYAAAPKEGYSSPIDGKYNRKKDADGNDIVMKGAYGGEYYIYSDPIYFYIDVMKNIPKLELSPDPSKMIFTAGDKIDLNNRFEISGYKDTSSNGWEGYLRWGGADNGETVDGIFYDHFAYTFFISDRLSGRLKNHLSGEFYEEYMRINNWPKSDDWDEKGGDQYSYVDWQEIPEGSELIGTNIEIGDKIKTDDINPDTRLPEYITVDQTYLEEHPEKKLQAGDMEVGITYNSSKGYGAEYEKWSLEFLKEGIYKISYIIRPWNHVRWDIGTGQAVTYTFEVTTDPVETKILLDHNYDIAFACEDFTESVATVIAPTYNNLDVTENFTLSYTAKAVKQSEEDDNIYIIKDDGEWSVLYITNADETENEIFRVNKTGGEVKFNESYAYSNTKVGVTVNATKITSVNYQNPAPVDYTIEIVSCEGRAEWEIISKCKNNPCQQSGETLLNNGKFHFLKSGFLYGGTVIRGVPGIDMTIGTKNTDPTLMTKWGVLRSEQDISKNGCQHEEQIGYHAYVAHENAPSLDEDGLTPLRGTFYAFRPITNGFLTVDANWNGKVRLVKRDNVTGETALVEEVETLDLIGEHTFEKPLMNGNTYYVYIEGDKLHLHGFSYDPAFVRDETTRKDESIESYMFLNGMTNKPALLGIKDGTVSFEILGLSTDPEAELPGKGTEIGDIKPLRFTESPLTIRATVKSSLSAEQAGNCVTKYPEYKLNIIDIPSYRMEVAKTDEDISKFQKQPLTRVRTTNIPTAITMTFGGWMDADGGYYKDPEIVDNKRLFDQWNYKSGLNGAANRIGSDLEDNDPTYNKTFDGFDYFIASNNNPLDEKSIPPLPSKANVYRYASGTEAEKEGTYNTTYRIPCRGAYLKFEPEESGTVLLYLVQNGSVDFHYGITNLKDIYKVKWRPLYITDETGKPATMASEETFTGFKDLLPTGSDPKNVTYFTLGISRCSKKEKKIEELTGNNSAVKLVEGCDFDWTDFRGTDDDRDKLLKAWADKGEREEVVPLSTGGFMLPHKAYVRYAFRVRAGRTYYVFQPGSKFEFGGFSFVPTGYTTNTCKYERAWASKDGDDMWKWTATENAITQEKDIDMHWKESTSDFSDLTANENINVTILDEDDRGNSKNRKFTKDKWNSICLPFSVSESQLEEKFGKDYLLVTVDGINEKGQLQFVRHAHQYIEAGRPYLFKPAISCDKLVFHNVTIQTGEKVGGHYAQTAEMLATNPARFDVPVEDYTFKGFYSQQSMPKGSVYAATDGLYMMNADGGKIGGYRALFCLQENGQAKAMEFTIDDVRNDLNNNQTTGIVYVSDDEMRTLPANADVYTTSGIKVGKGVKALNSLQKGIYIVNGEKIAVR